MNRKLFGYIWSHVRRDQTWVIIVTILAMIPYYMSFDLPKQIINGPITGIGFSSPGDTLSFLRLEMTVPGLGPMLLFPGVQLERMLLLFALSFAFLALVIINGLVEIYVNADKGRLGDRLLRRIRFDLIDRPLRFPRANFKSLKPGEVASMVKDEVGPGFVTGDQSLVHGTAYFVSARARGPVQTLESARPALLTQIEVDLVALDDLLHSLGERNARIERMLSIRL